MAGTNRSIEAHARGGPSIVLVEPQLGENIGMVARAMANFGLGDLRLVNPREPWPNERANATAAKADHVIQAARVFDSLKEAIEDLNTVYATTARSRDGFKPVLGPQAACEEIRRADPSGISTGILFGRERWGLDNEEVSLADAIVTFPVDPSFASLNIAQAVLLMAYEYRRGGELQLASAKGADGPEPAKKVVFNAMIDWLETSLEARGYFRTADKKPKMMENLRAVLTRPAFSAEEIAVLRGIFTALDRFRPRTDERGDRK